MAGIKAFVSVPLAYQVRALIRLDRHYQCGLKKKPVSVADIFTGMGVNPRNAKALEDCFIKIDLEEDDTPLGPRELRPTDSQIRAMLLGETAVAVRKGEGEAIQTDETLMQVFGWRKPHIVRQRDEMLVRVSDLQKFDRAEFGVSQFEPVAFYWIDGFERQKLPKVVEVALEYIGRGSKIKGPKLHRFKDGSLIKLTSEQRDRHSRATQQMITFCVNYSSARSGEERLLQATYT